MQSDFMWNEFSKSGKISDYLQYARCLEQEPTMRKKQFGTEELNKSANNCAGTGYQGEKPRGR